MKFIHRFVKVGVVAIGFLTSSMAFAGNCDPGDYCVVCGQDACVVCYPNGSCQIFPKKKQQ